MPARHPNRIPVFPFPRGFCFCLWGWGCFCSSCCFMTLSSQLLKSLAVVPPTIYSCLYNSYMIVECKLPQLRYSWFFPGCLFCLPFLREAGRPLKRSVLAFLATECLEL